MYEVLTSPLDYGGIRHKKQDNFCSDHSGPQG